MKVTIKLNSPGIRRLLQSDDMRKAVLNVAESQGEVDTTYIGGDRVHVIVKKEEGVKND